MVLKNDFCSTADRWINGSESSRGSSSLSVLKNIHLFVILSVRLFEK
jgi:hypothetical protein